MSPMDPTLVMLALLLGGLGLYLLAAPRRIFTLPEDRPEYRPGAVERDSPRGHWLRWVLAPTLILFALAVAWIVLFGAPQSLGGRATLALGVALTPLALALAQPAVRPRGAKALAREIALNAYLGACVFDLLSGPGRHPSAFDFVLLAVLAIGFVIFVVELFGSWRDEAELAEMFDASQGYIERPRRLSVRTKALLMVAVSGAVLVLGTINYIHMLSTE